MPQEPLHLRPVRGRSVYAIAGVLALTGTWACWCGAALTWDGAYQFCRTLVEGQAYAYGGRLHSWLLWQPVVLLSHFTRNPIALAIVYGLPFAAAPVAGCCCRGGSSSGIRP